MRATSGIAVLLAALIGCGPGKQLPDAAPRGPSAPQPEPATQIPARSDDAARAVVDAALKATSGGDVARIERVKAFRSSAKGVMKRPVGGQELNLETTREFDAAWPSACRLRVDSQSLKPFTIGLRRPLLWMREGTTPVPVPDPKHAEEIAAIDTLGQNWLVYLVPLYDPKVIVFDPAAVTTAEKKFDTVKVAVPGYPVFGLAFNEAKLLARVEYTNAEMGAAVTKVLLFTDHRPFDGIQLPTRVESVRNGTLVEQWTVTKWEVVEKHDPAIFDEPR